MQSWMGGGGGGGGGNISVYFRNVRVTEVKSLVYEYVILRRRRPWRHQRDSLCSPILRSGTCSVHYVMIVRERLSIVETQKGKVICRARLECPVK